MKQHSMLPEDMCFKEETFVAAMARYIGFGRELFFRLDSHFPGILSKIRFFQSQDVHCEEDVWAYYDNDSLRFGIPLEPSCQVIVLWDDEPGNQIEIGYWWDDEYEAAIAFIEEVFFGKTPSGKFSF